MPSAERLRRAQRGKGRAPTPTPPLQGGADRMTTTATHLWRLLRWGRTLARHGALSGIERDPLTPAPLRRLVRIARLGARVPKVPRYADALEAIGPAAIKLGQTLATRPDLVGEAAALDLYRLQDALPPVPFAADQGIDRASLRPPDRGTVPEHRRGAGRRRLDRAGPPCGHHRRPAGGGEGAAPRRRGRVRPRHRNL